MFFSRDPPTIKNDLNVSGHDANVSEEGVGELKYTLCIADADHLMTCEARFRDTIHYGSDQPRIGT